MSTVIGGLKSIGASVAQVLASLVGQAISAGTLTLTSTAQTVLTLTGTGARIIFDTTQYIVSSNTTGRLFSTGGYVGPSYALGNTGGGPLFMSFTAPTISSGFGTSPSIVAYNGTAAFTINVGIGGAASTGVIGLPAATTGWAVTVQNLTNPDSFVTAQTATTTTTASLKNYSRTTGLAIAWTASDVLLVKAMAY